MYTPQSQIYSLFSVTYCVEQNICGLLLLLLLLLLRRFVDWHDVMADILLVKWNVPTGKYTTQINNNTQMLKPTKRKY